MLTILAAFVVSVDVFLNLEGYLRAARHVAGQDAGPVRTAVFAALAVIDLWGPRLLQLAPQLVGASLIAGVGFTCAQFQRKREFVAVLASGVSLHRLSAPIIAVALAAVTLVALTQEFILPPMAHLLSRTHGQVLQRRVNAFAVPLLPDGQRRLFYASAFDPNDQQLRDALIWERDDAGRVLRRIAASSATWDGDAWALEDGQAEDAEHPGVFTPVVKIRSDLSPTAITALRVRGYAESLSLRSIKRALAIAGSERDSSFRKRLNAIGWGRLAVLEGMLLATVVALPFFLQREPANMVQQSMKAAPLAVGVLVTSAVGSAWPAPGLPIWIGVSIAPMIALPVALWALASIRT